MRKKRELQKKGNCSEEKTLATSRQQTRESFSYVPAGRALLYRAATSKSRRDLTRIAGAQKGGMQKLKLPAHGIEPWTSSYSMTRTIRAWACKK